MSEMDAKAILQVEDLKKYFPVRRGLLQRQTGWVKAVDGVSFTLQKGKILGLVGESGCGKTTTGRMVLRVLDPTAGSVLFRRNNGEVVDMAKLSRAAIKEVRREVQMIFQDPYSSLNPRMPVLDLIAEPLKAHGWNGAECEKRVAELMERVGLDPRYIRRYPHAFSGGQRQRIGIARALALRPSLIVADEPVSALDVSVQAQILNLLKELQQDLDLTLLFVAHDLSVVRYLCDEVAVMYKGRLVEQAETEQLFTQPRHPYTAMLLNAAPAPDPHAVWLEDEDEVDAVEPVEQVDGVGCAFAPRCRYASEKCRQQDPILTGASTATRHLTACHHQRDIALKGV
jgi:oligopeptide/dipeptide ABC transporter ATP-binding protein